MKSHIGHTDESPISIFTKLTQNQKKRIQLVKFIMRCMIGILKKEFKIRTHSGLEGLRIENTHKTLKSNKPHGTKPHEKKKEEKQ